MNDVVYWIWLTEIFGAEPAAQRYVDYFGDIKELYNAGERELKYVSGDAGKLKQLMNKDLTKAWAILERCRELGIGLISQKDTIYPQRLLNIYNPPRLLYYKGRLVRFDELPVIGIVGTRSATPRGIAAAERFGNEITCHGGIVVTGLAEGIDSASARGALSAGGFVAGVLGTGIDVAFPAWNTEFQETVARKGILISEYPPGTKGSRAAFPNRNRIISGLSVGVLVVEAPKLSGSLITAARANEQGRDIFAVPGDIRDSNYAGSNLLIRDGAALVTCGWDVMEEYRWRFPDIIRAPKELKRRIRKKRGEGHGSGTEDMDSSKKVVDNHESMEYIDLKEQLEDMSDNEIAVVTSLSDQVKTSDEVIEETGLAAHNVLSALTLLEIKGYVRALEGSRFELLVTKKAE